MNRLISSRIALDLLSKSAPREWCKKFLIQLIFEGQISAFALSGHLKGYFPLLALLNGVDLAPVDGDRFWSAVKKQYGASAPTEKDLMPTPRGATLAPVTGYRWYADDTSPAHQIGFGYFHYADSIDWEAGNIRIDSFFPAEQDEEFFMSGDLMFGERRKWGDDQFTWLEFYLELGDLSFESSAIELLAGLETQLPKSPRSAVGRPTKWDWVGAMLAVVKLANSPDGISQERGEQAKVERAMASWFLEFEGSEPNSSQIREHAARVMDYLANK